MDHCLIEWDSPTGGIAAAILFFFLNLNPHQGRSLTEHLQEFDFIGLFLIVSGIVILLLGFNQSETSCEHLWSGGWVYLYLTFHPGSSKSTIALLAVGGVVLVAGAVNEVYTKRSPIIPPRLFRVSWTALYDAGTLSLLVSWGLDPNHCHYFNCKFPAWCCFFLGHILSSSLLSSSWCLRNRGWCRVSVILDAGVGGLESWLITSQHAFIFFNYVGPIDCLWYNCL